MEVKCPFHLMASGMHVSTRVTPGDVNWAHTPSDVCQVSPPQESYSLVPFQILQLLQGESLCLTESSPQPRAGGSDFASYREGYQRIWGLR